MKKILFIALVFINFGFSQTVKSQEYYMGTLGNLKIELYLKLLETGCPNTYAEVMYKYEKNSENDWLLCNTTINDTENGFTMVELYNTGILLLNKKGNTLNGFWISPDGSKKIKITLKKQNITPKKLKKLEEALEKEMYEANDC